MRVALSIVMGLVGVHLVCGVDGDGRATSIEGVAFVCDKERKVSWFALPLPLVEPVEVEGPTSETESGVRLGVVSLSGMAEDSVVSGDYR